MTAEPQVGCLEGRALSVGGGGLWRGEWGAQDRRGWGEATPILPYTEPSFCIPRLLFWKTPAWGVASRGPVPASHPPPHCPSCLLRQERLGLCLSQGGQQGVQMVPWPALAPDSLGLSHLMSTEADSLPIEGLTWGSQRWGGRPGPLRCPQITRWG